MASTYITAEGFEALRTELKDLWVKRRDVVAHLSAAAAEGDRSENAEYIYRKKQLRELDRRIRYLQKRLPDLQVVREKPATREKVFFGASVTLSDDDDQEYRHRIVGADETDAKQGWISIDAPMARALLGRCINDEVIVATPDGNKTYWITAVNY